MPGIDDLAAAEFGIDNPSQELEKPDEGAQTGHEEGAGEGAPKGQTPEPEKLEIPDKFKNAEGRLDEAKVLKAYQESENSRSRLDQERARLEAEKAALSPVVEKANEIIDRQTQGAEPSLEERKQVYYQGIGENPYKVHADALNSPEVKEVLKKAVQEATQPFVEQQNQDRIDGMIKEAKVSITIDKGYPVNFGDHIGDIGRILDERPWLRRDPSCLKLAYSVMLDQRPELLKNWEPKKPGTGPAIPHTETGSGAAPKTETRKTEEDKEWEEIVRAGPKMDSVLV